MVANPRTLFSPGTWAEDGRVAQILRKETVGGGLLLLALWHRLAWAEDSRLWVVTAETAAIGHANALPSLFPAEENA